MSGYRSEIKASVGPDRTGRVGGDALLLVRVRMFDCGADAPQPDAYTNLRPRRAVPRAPAARRRRRRRTANRASRLLEADTVSAPAKTQALEALVEAHARELHLPAIRARFRQLAAEATREQQTPLAYLAALLQAEVSERSERRERRRLLDARFPTVKRLEQFRFYLKSRVI